MNKKESFIIQGLAGEKRLSGTVIVHGAKNAALKTMAAAVLFDGPVQLENIPDTDDVRTMTMVLQKLGAKVTLLGNYKLEIDTGRINSTDIDQQLAGSMRASVVLTGPLLGRFGNVSFPAPGGCVIGARPIDLFIEGYKKMGAETTEKDCVYNIEVKSNSKLNCAEITFKMISVGATETLMMAAVLADGKTTLRNCACEPEIVNVAEWLNNCGAKIKGAGTSIIEIEGTGGKLLSPRVPYLAIPDRIEAGSFLLLGALCAKDLAIEKCRPDHLDSLITLLKGSGVPIEIDQDSIRITSNTRPNSTFRALNVNTKEYPGFPTDLQAPAVTFLTQVTGKSTVTENIFEGRLKYVEDLKKMGAQIEVRNSNSVTVNGPSELHQARLGQELDAHDIRAGFAIVMAALVGKGTFKVNKVHLIDRGYERLEVQLRQLGAGIERK